MTSESLPALLPPVYSDVLSVCACTALPSVPSLFWEKTLIQSFLGGQGCLSLPTIYWLPQAAWDGSALPSWELAGSHGIASCTPLDCQRHMGKDSAVCLGYTFFIDSLLSSFTAP